MRLWASVFTCSAIWAITIGMIVLPFLNTRLKRKANWIDVATSVFPLIMAIISPLFGEYGYHVQHGEDYQAVAFDDEGNVTDSSEAFVWCVTNNCANAPWKIKVAFDEAAITDGKIKHFMFEGIAEVTDYNRFFTITGVIKPTGWWDTPGGYQNVGALQRAVQEQLCRLVTHHTSELANVSFPLPRSRFDTSVDDLVERYAQPSLSQYGIKYTVTKFWLKNSCDCGQGEVPPREKFGPSAY